MSDAKIERRRDGAPKITWTTPFRQRFWLRVQRGGDDECWPWTGAANQGYGVLNFEGRTVYATHASLFLNSGSWPPQGLVVCHSCDNPCCVNPRHLWVGTQSQNIRDAMEKRRFFTPHQRNPVPATHCRRGHLFDEANTLNRRDGRRSCRQCKRARQREWEMAR